MSYCDGCAMTRDLRQEIERLREALTEQAGVKQTVYNAAVRKLESQHREIERLREALTRIHGNLQPACAFCTDHRKWAGAALAPARESGT